MGHEIQQPPAAAPPIATATALAAASEQRYISLTTAAANQLRRELQRPLPQQAALADLKCQLTQAEMASAGAAAVLRHKLAESRQKNEVQKQSHADTLSQVDAMVTGIQTKLASKQQRHRKRVAGLRKRLSDEQSKASDTQQALTQQLAALQQQLKQQQLEAEHALLQDQDRILSLEDQLRQHKAQRQQDKQAHVALCHQEALLSLQQRLKQANDQIAEQQEEVQQAREAAAASDAKERRQTVRLKSVLEKLRMQQTGALATEQSLKEQIGDLQEQLNKQQATSKAAEQKGAAGGRLAPEASRTEPERVHRLKAVEQIISKDSAEETIKQAVCRNSRSQR